ncbi:MAG: hypothetical protein ACP5NV_06965 [Candidatus Woesearchaeota archaeon]
MSKIYDLTTIPHGTLSSIVKEDFPDTKIIQIIGIAMEEKHLDSTKTQQVNHFTPIYFGESIIIPYFDKNIQSTKSHPIHINTFNQNVNVKAIPGEIFICKISEITSLEYSLFGIDNMNAIPKITPKHGYSTHPNNISADHILTGIYFSNIQLSR